MSDGTSATPREWRKTTLGGAATYINGYAFKPGDWSEQGVPIVRIAQMTNPNADYDHHKGVLPAQYGIDSGDLLFSWSATLATLIWDRGPAYLNQHLFKVIPAVGTELAFLHHLLDFHMDGLSGQAHGTTMRHIKRSDLLPFTVDLPSLREQRRIAEILDTLDEAIRRTEQIIAKLKQIKQGLLHDLLTRGIDENGELRDPERHPEQFGDSPLGMMPRTWDVVECSSICKEIVVGIVIRPAQYYREDGVPVLRSANVREHGIVLDDLVFMSDADHKILSKSAVVPGDLVTVRTGYPGTTAVVPDTLATANCVDIIISRPGAGVRSDYLNVWINSDAGKGQVLKGQGGLAQQHFNVAEMKRLLVAIPPPQEQANISERAAALEERLRVETAATSKLRLLKQGLMEDLLTGRVRVTTLGSAA